MKQLITGVMVALLVAVGSAMAASIPVTNPGFESAALGDGGFLRVEATGLHGWYEENGSAWPPAYYKNVPVSEFTSVPELEHILQLDCRPSNGIGYVEQPNIVAIDEAKVYTLRVYVGCNVGGVFSPQYYVALMKGTAVAARYSSTIAVTADNWVEVTVTYAPMPGDSGKMLGIRLGNRLDLIDASLYFDDVRLDDADRVDFTNLVGVNWGFENPVLPDIALLNYTQLDDSGSYAWYDGNGAAFGGVYIENPLAATFPSGVPQGTNAAVLDVRDAPTKNTIVQTNILEIEEGKVYTLTAKVGHSATQGFPQDSFVRLTKDGARAGDDASHIDPGADNWYDATVVYAPMPGDEGKMLGIAMGNQVGGAPGSYLWFDDVQLTCADNPLPGSTYVLNWSFEDPDLPDGAYFQLDDSGIYAWDDANGAANWPGVFIYDISGAQFPSGPPHGDNAIQLDVRDGGTKNSVIQTNILVIDEDYGYSLSAKMGKSPANAFPQDCFVRLLADVDTVAEVTTNAAPTDDTWVEFNMTYIPAAGDGGKTLGIEMGNQVGGASGSYLWFDDVRLSFARIYKGSVVVVK